MFHQRVVPLLLLIFALIVAVPHAQEAGEDATPCPPDQVFDEERGACVERGSIELTIATPQWIRDYPIATDIVQAFVTQQRVTFLTSVFDLRPDDPLTFDVDYEEARYEDRLASVLLRVEYDLGEEFPLSEIRALTLDLELGVPVELADLLLPNANPVSTFAPLIPPEAVEEGFVSLVSGGLDDPALFENFLLSDEGITFYYPPFLQSGVAAGERSVFLPMEVAGQVLILPDPLPEATQEAQ